jgi:hypothetical protein
MLRESTAAMIWFLEAFGEYVGKMKAYIGGKHGCGIDCTSKTFNAVE